MTSGAYAEGHKQELLVYKKKNSVVWLKVAILCYKEVT